MRLCAAIRHAVVGTHAEGMPARRQRLEHYPVAVGGGQPRVFVVGIHAEAAFAADPMPAHVAQWLAVQQHHRADQVIVVDRRPACSSLQDTASSTW